MFFMMKKQQQKTISIGQRVADLELNDFVTYVSYTSKTVFQKPTLLTKAITISNINVG